MLAHVLEDPLLLGVKDGGVVTISEGTEERVSNSSSSRDLCVTDGFFPNAWEQISIQSLLLEPRVKVRNGKSENEVSLHFF